MTGKRVIGRGRFWFLTVPILAVLGVFLVLYGLKTKSHEVWGKDPGHGEHPAPRQSGPATALEQEVEDFFQDESEQERAGERTLLFYRNPMNPAITSAVPAKDEMGMDYIPVYDDEASGSGGGIPGMAPVALTRQGIELSGVVTVPAVSETMVKTIRTVGRVVADETRIYRVQTRVSGWVETLHVNVTGQSVTRGAPLMTLYSPELLTGQEELIRALEARDRAKSSGSGKGSGYLETLVDAARRRLLLYDVPEASVSAIETQRRVQPLITLDAPAPGIVTSREVFQGQQVEPGMALLTLTDFSRVWVEADVYEFEARLVHNGLSATIASPYDPNLAMTGSVTYVYPYLDTDSRTVRARMEFDNPDLALKPGMFVDVTLGVDLGETLVVPDSAVMYSGVRNLVFVNTSGGRFEPREVTVGARSRGKTQVLSGVSPGDPVAIRANFLLDSESRLQAIIQGAIKGRDHDPKNH